MSLNRNLVDCFGSVNVLTEDLVVFQGRINKDRGPGHNGETGEEKKEYIEIVLECIPAFTIITGSAIDFVGLPIYTVGSTVKINLDEIIAVGPNTAGCLVT